MNRDRWRDLQEPLGVAPIPPPEETGWLQVHPLPQRRRVKKMISDDIDVFQLVPVATGDVVLDQRAIRLGFGLLEFDLRIEVAFGTEILHQVSLAFDQQAAIHGPFLVNRHQLAQAAAGNIRPALQSWNPAHAPPPDRRLSVSSGRAHLHNGPTVDGQVRRNRIARGMIVQLVQGDLGFQPIPFLKILPNALDACLDLSLRHTAPSRKPDKTQAAMPSGTLDHAR